MLMGPAKPISFIALVVFVISTGTGPRFLVGVPYAESRRLIRVPLPASNRLARVRPYCPTSGGGGV